jgi:UDP-N-acetylenolpyruvoylglucosamine reductase
LIEQAGLRKRFGDAGIHKNQALVLVTMEMQQVKKY